MVLLRELRSRGYDGSYTILADYVRPRRRQRQLQATVRFETAPGEQAQVDWGSLAYIGADGRKHRIWVFVMVLSWSRACYVELVRRADTAAFIQCHVNAFEYLGGVPRRCLYDNAKVVTLGRDEENRPVWNLRMLDFARRVGFEMRLCRPYRAQTKGKVESGVKYVRRNMWPSICFTDDADLNRQGLEWCDTVANRRVHGTTHRVPQEMLAEEQPHLGKLPDRADSVAPSPGGPQGGPGRLRQLGRLPLRSPLEMGGRHGAGGPAAGDGGDLGRRPADRGASQGPGTRSTLHPARSVVRSAQSGWPSPQGSGGGAGPGGRGGTALPGRVRAGRCGRCQMIALEQARQHLETLGLKQAVEVLDNTLDVAASKQALWKAIHHARLQGVSLRGIARQLGISRNTVRKYVDLSAPPANRTPRRTTQSGTQLHANGHFP